MAGPTNADVVVKAIVPKDTLARLQKLAELRGVSANTVLVQALERDLFLSDNEAKGGPVLIQEKDKTLSRVVSK